MYVYQLEWSYIKNFGIVKTQLNVFSGIMKIKLHTLYFNTWFCVFVTEMVRESYNDFCYRIQQYSEDSVQV